MRSKITAISICAVLIGTALLGFLQPDRFFSLREKRKLRQMPEFSWESLWNGSYMEQLEDYSLDQFPARDSWISIKTVNEILLGKREFSGVYLGKNGWLMDAFTAYDPQVLRQNVDGFARLSRELEIPVRVMLIPTASEILSDQLPAFAPRVSESEILSRLAEQGLELIPVSDALKAHRDEYLYYRTDHHYTSLGAWYCYETWQKAVGRESGSPQDWTKEPLCQDFYGTTWSKVGLPWTPPDEITGWYRHRSRTVTYNDADVRDSMYAEEYLARDPYGVFLNSNQALTVIEGSGTKGELLLIKDSFGNTFSQFPAECFSRVHVIDLRFFRENIQDYVREHAITEVLILYGIENFSQNPILF